MLRVLLVDDHPQYRRCVRDLLDQQIDLRAVGEAASAEEALRICRCQAASQSPLPQVVLMDLRMPGRGGIEGTRDLLAEHPALAVLGHSSHDDPALVRAFAAAGGAGYLLKDAPQAELLAAIRAVAAGERGVGLIAPSRPALPPDLGTTGSHGDAV